MPKKTGPNASSASCGHSHKPPVATPGGKTKSAAKAPTRLKTIQKPSPKTARSSGKTASATAGGSAQMSAYLRSYKGLQDWHIPVFRSIAKLIIAHQIADPPTSFKTLYPGCHRHITASLFLPSVTYIDSDAKVQGLYSDPKALAYVAANKEYEGESHMLFKHKNFDQNLGLPDGSFDLIISASAGIVSVPCGRYLKKGGFLLVSDAHYDARMAYASPKLWELYGVYDGESETFTTDTKGHFQLKSGGCISMKEVQESIDVPEKRKRSFSLLKETLFYAFRRK
mmetsp:Transcript_13397/g.26424  ORF Transcript_13397/g.26424 Transcript_13397/m.26424 type:complete len:283 (+) Transcript_13397:121-969(+)